jgi:hypothetical protein
MNDHPSYAVVDPGAVADLHDATDIPGEFRPLTEALDTRQLAVSFVRVPAHTDFERGTAHVHEEVEELYLISRGTLTMRCGDDFRRRRPFGSIRRRRARIATRATSLSRCGRSPGRSDGRIRPGSPASGTARPTPSGARDDGADHAYLLVGRRVPVVALV